MYGSSHEKVVTVKVDANNICGEKTHDFANSSAQNKSRTDTRSVVEVIWHG